MYAGRQGRTGTDAHRPLPSTTAVATVVFLVAVACSRGSGAPSRGPSARSNISTPSPAAASSIPSVSDAEKYPNLSRFTDPFDQLAYKTAYSDCRLIGIEGAAEAFGGDPVEPLSVAQAFAMATFPKSEEHRQASLQGCLDAFETETA